MVEQLPHSAMVAFPLAMTAVALTVVAAPFETMLFMDLNDTTDAWGLVWPQAGTVTAVDPTVM